MKNVVQTFARNLGAISPGCKEAARLQSTALDGRLTFFERLGLRFHLVLCRWCRRYGRQIMFLRSAARDHAHDDPPSPPPGLSPAARERIKRRLQSEKQ
jgi:hypothetical protein